MTNKLFRITKRGSQEVKVQLCLNSRLIILLALLLFNLLAGPVMALENIPGLLNADANNNAETNANNEAVFVAKPVLQALITFRRNLSPYSLDAAHSKEVDLGDVLNMVLERSLDIRLADIYEKKSKVSYFGSIANALPDINSGYQDYYLKGNLSLPPGFGGGGPIDLSTPFQVLSAGFRYYGYRGGSVLFGALQNRNLYKAARYAKHATISDALLEASKRYYKLVLAEAILQIRIKMLDVSKEQAALSHHLKDAGIATSLDVFQSDTQLTQDRQDLINQQVERRRAALELAELLNMDQDMDFIPVDSTIRMVHSVSDNVPVQKLVGIAVLNRPELNELREKRLAAQKSAVVAAAPLQPTLSLSGTTYGIGTSANNLSKLNVLALGVNWNLVALGSQSIADIKNADLNIHESKVKLNKEYNRITKQVRESYLEILRTQQEVEEASKQVHSATEELRVARMRFKNGLTKNIDVLRAQGDSTKSMIAKAQAIVDFNIAQLQLLHDIGIINVNTLLAAKPVVQS